MLKTTYTFSVCFILFLAALHPANAAPNDPVTIPDDNLREAINNEIDPTRAPDADITEAEMGTLTELIVKATRDFTAPPYPIVNEVTNLTGLEHATGLTTLTITNNRVSQADQLNADKLSPILGLPLETLNLGYNNIADISSLSGLTSLTSLNLEQNKIEDIRPLEGLTALEHLNLWSNPITDISILTTTNFPALKYLNIQDTWVRDFSPLDPGNWVQTYKEFPDSAPYEEDAGTKLLICNGALEDWDYANDNDGPPLTDLTRLQDQLDKPTCAPVFTLTGDATSVRLVVDADADLTPNYVTLTYVYRYRKSGDSWPDTSTDTARPQWTGGFVNPPPGEDGSPDYQGVIEATQVGEGETEYAVDITGLDPSAVYHFQVFGSFLQGGNIRAIYPPGSETQCWSTSDRAVVVCPEDSSPRTGNPNNPHGLTVTFADYPEEKPTDEFTLTIRFSQPVIGFEKEDITVETELTSGKEDATVVDLTPETPPDALDPIQTYTATVELPSRARGTVTLIVRADAATNPTEKIGPSSDTASDPIEFGRRVIICPPSVVPMDTIIFNEFHNAEDDTHDWIELKNISDEDVSLAEWEVSLVVPHAIGPATPQWEIVAMDRDVVAFGDWTLPAGGILLIVNTHPSETDLIRGQNIENPNHNPDLFPKYLIAPEMKLPSTPYLLILRSVRDQNGKYEGFEDLAGDYHKDDVNYATNIWPLRCTPVYTGTAARFTEGDVYQRVLVPKFSSRTLVSTLQPMERGYLEGAWTLSESHGGLGYRPGAPPEKRLGTPGYPVSGLPSEEGWETLSFSEVMYATNDNGGLSQWIELYNSTTEIVDLTDWRLAIEARDSKTVQRWTSLRLKSLHIGPNQTVLLVGRTARSSGNIPTDRIYDLYRRNTEAFRRLGEGANRFLGREGFSLRLFSPDGVLVDVVGNLDGRRTHDKPKWELPEGWTETGARTSLIRAYDNRVPGLGTVSESFVRAADTALLKGYSYWGLPTDNGTPGYRQGSPLPVTLSSMRADRAEGGVVVKWTTESEMENAGFHVLRSRDSKTEFVKVSPTLIPGAGTTAERQDYTYRDTTAQANVLYYYRLEEASLSGERRAVATVRLRGHVSPANKLLWKWADVKAAD